MGFFMSNHKDVITVQRDILSSVYYCPILLNSTRLSKFSIDGSIILRRLTKQERRYFFGVEKIEEGSEDQPVIFSPSKKKGFLDFREWYDRLSFVNSKMCFASNYLVEIETSGNPDLIISDLNLCFNLVVPTSTACYPSFLRDDSSVIMSSYRHRLEGLEYLKLDKKGLEKLKITYFGILALKGDIRFTTCSNLYIKSIHDDTSIEVRFLMVAISLENLFLCGEKNELAYKFSLRLSKLLNGQKKYDLGKIFYTARKIYDIRSDIAHSGMSKKLDKDIFIEAQNLSRESLNIYIKNKDYFSNNSLDNMCLKK